jgi:hypothetical protein
MQPSCQPIRRLRAQKGQQLVGSSTTFRVRHHVIGIGHLLARGEQRRYQMLAERTVVRRRTAAVPLPVVVHVFNQKL